MAGFRTKNEGLNMIKKIIFSLVIFSLSQSLLATDLQGQFVQPCQTIDDDTIQQSLIFISSQSAARLAARLAWEISAFEDEKCQTPYLKISRRFDVVAQSSQSITVKTIQIAYTAVSEETAESLNYINYCGYTDWATGEVKDVTGRICDDYQQLKNNELKSYAILAQQNEITWDNDKTPYIRSEVSKIETVQ